MAPVKPSKPDRKERKCLQISEKLSIISARQAGVSVSSLAEKYTTHSTTIAKIFRDREKIERNASKLASIGVKKSSNEKYEQINKAVLAWFLTARRSGIPIGGTLIKEKAMSFASIFGVEDFKGSSGWLNKLLKRNNISLHTVKGEQLSANTDEADTFKVDFRAFIDENKYTAEEIYNGDETGKHIPRI